MNAATWALKRAEKLRLEEEARIKRELEEAADQIACFTQAIECLEEMVFIPADKLVDRTLHRIVWNHFSPQGFSIDAFNDKTAEDGKLVGRYFRLSVAPE